MTAISTTGTLTAGNSYTFDLAPGSALTLTLLPNCRVTVTEAPETVSASGVGGNSSRTHNHQLAGVFTYGPYPMGGLVTVANAANSGSTVTWGRKDSAVAAWPSSLYKFFIPGQQFIGSGNAKDRSGNSADAVRGASLTDAAAWANPGYITTTSGADRFLSVPVAKSAFNLVTQSIIFSARMKKATTAGTEYFFGNAETTTHAGFSLDMRATSGGVSKIKLRINNGSSLTSLADSTATFGEAAATDHVVGVAIDGITKAAYLWCDGCLSDTYAAAFTGGALSDLDFAIGSNFGTSGNTAVVGQFSGIHLLAMNGGLPLNIAQVMQRLAGNPHMPLTNLELQF